MAWKTSTTTKHSTDCKMVFGRKDANCPRCQELMNGAEPVKWASSFRQNDARRCAEIRNHDCKVSRCSVVCTFGDW